MDILYMLIPLSVLLILAILGLFGWALNAGQFDDLDQHGEQILDAAAESLDLHQGHGRSLAQESVAPLGILKGGPP